MARCVVFGTVAAARTARDYISARFGYPSPGFNLATGLPVEPGQDGWTIAYFSVAKVTDANGIYGPAGQSYFVIGPISPSVESRLLQLTNPPTIVTVPNVLLRKGVRYAQSISGWSGGLPTLAEDQSNYDEDAAGF